MALISTQGLTQLEFRISTTRGLLKACPFCGGDRPLMTSNVNHETRSGAIVQSRISCSETRWGGLVLVNSKESLDAAQQSAMEQWELRAQPPAGCTGRALADALELQGRDWLLDGDLIRCRACNCGQLASNGHLVFMHNTGSSAAEQVGDLPWVVYLRLLSGLDRPDARPETSLPFLDS